MVVDDGAYTFTPEQQEAIAGQVTDAMLKYESGEYPLHEPEATNHTPFAQPWPAELPFLEGIAPGDLVYTTEGFEMQGVGAVLTAFSEKNYTPSPAKVALCRVAKSRNPPRIASIPRLA